MPKDNPDDASKVDETPETPKEDTPKEDRTPEQISAAEAAAKEKAAKEKAPKPGVYVAKGRSVSNKGKMLDAGSVVKKGLIPEARIAELVEQGVLVVVK